MQKRSDLNTRANWPGEEIERAPMKILLIEPGKAPISIGGEDFFIFESLALEYIAAGVCNDHDVKIFDMRLEKNLQEFLEDFAPDVVGITAYTVHVNNVRRLFEKINPDNPSQEIN